MAAIGRNSAIIGPSITQERATESAPVSGVEIRKDVVEAREAPARYRVIATGRVPQEQSGSGAPIKAALITVMGPDPPNALLTIGIGIHAWIRPAAISPNNSQGAESKASRRVFSISAMIMLAALMFRFRHRINPALMEWMTAQDPLGTEPETAQHPVQLYRLLHIGRTARIVATVVAQQGANQVAIPLDQKDEKPSHPDTFSAFRCRRMIWLNMVDSK